jgi:opacity protein-like surface antigen
MKFTTGLLASLVLVAAPAMAAEDSGFYVGASVGIGSYSINDGKVSNAFESRFAEHNITLSTGSSQVNDDATTWQAIVGYRILPYLAVEGSWLDLAGATYKGEGVARFGASTAVLPVTTRGEWNASGFPLTALGILPIGDTWEVFLRAGVFIGNVDMKLKVETQDGAQQGHDNTSQSSTQFIGGAGVNANFLDNWTARFEWEAMPSIGNDKTGSANWNQLALSVLYKF